MDKEQGRLSKEDTAEILPVTVYDLEFGEDIKHTFLFKKKNVNIWTVFGSLETEELRPLAKSILEKMCDVLSSSQYSFALRNNGRGNTISIEEDSQKFSESFVSYPTATELIQHFFIDKDCDTTIGDIICMYIGLSDVPELEICGFDETSVDWEVDTCLIISGEPHILKFQTEELSKTIFRKIWENDGCILQDFVYKIYEGIGETFVWYFVSEEERKRFTGK
jgi:hypothetical protein